MPGQIGNNQWAKLGSRSGQTRNKCPAIWGVKQRTHGESTLGPTGKRPSRSTEITPANRQNRSRLIDGKSPADRRVAFSEDMGHSKIALTMHLYGHLMPGNESQAARLLDAYLEAERFRLEVPIRRNGPGSSHRRRLDMGYAWQWARSRPATAVISGDGDYQQGGCGS